MVLTPHFCETGTCKYGGFGISFPKHLYNAAIHFEMKCSVLMSDMYVYMYVCMYACMYQELLKNHNKFLVCLHTLGE